MGFFSKKWDVQTEVPDLTGKLIVITGANSGIGFEASHQLASRGAKIVLACRSEAKAKAAIEELKLKEPQGEFVFKQLDVSSFESIRNFAATWGTETIDVLVENAGIMASNELNVTEDGRELQFATNNDGPFLLASLLMEHMSPEGRIVNVASLAHTSVKGTSCPLPNDDLFFSLSLTYTRVVQTSSTII